MKESRYKSFDELPLMLNAEMVADVLGISRAGAYELMNEDSFPVKRIGKRIIVPKDAFQKWLDTVSLSYKPYPTRDAKKNYFLLSNEIFDFGLSSTAIALYAYLMKSENRKTYAGRHWRKQRICT